MLLTDSAEEDLGARLLERASNVGANPGLGRTTSTTASPIPAHSLTLLISRSLAFYRGAVEHLMAMARSIVAYP